MKLAPESQRRVPRYSASVVFYGYSHYGLSSQVKWNGILLELSLLGCGFASNQSLNILDRVVISLAMTYKDEKKQLQSISFKQYATVRYRNMANTDSPNYIYGCEFDELHIATVFELEKIISYIQFSPPTPKMSDNSLDEDEDFI